MSKATLISTSSKEVTLFDFCVVSEKLYARGFLNIYRCDLTTGLIDWEIPLPGDTRFGKKNILTHENRVFTFSDKGRDHGSTFYCFDNEGNQLWERDLKLSPDFNGVVIAGNQLIILAVDSVNRSQVLTALDVEYGEIIHSTKISVGYNKISSWNGLLFLGGRDGLCLVDLQTMTIKETLLSPIILEVIPEEDRLIICSEGDKRGYNAIHILHKDMTLEANKLLYESSLTYNAVLTTPDKNVVLFPKDEGGMIKYDLSSGKVLWEIGAGGWTGGESILVNDTIIIRLGKPDFVDEVVMIDHVSGKILEVMATTEGIIRIHKVDNSHMIVFEDFLHYYKIN